MEPDAGGRWVERMFPEPDDHGIARPDRAVCTVRSGTDTGEQDTGDGERWYEGGGRVGERAHRDIVVYPPTRGMATQGAAFEPVKIGVLVDMDIGQLLADWLHPTILALEDAMNERVTNTNGWAAGLEGWHGVDRLGEDGANPNNEAIVERFSRRLGRVSRNVVVALAYDTARAAIHGIANAAMATPEAVRDGLERIRLMPVTRELRGGELRFDGYHRPQWPSNATPSPA
jgi:hypothetical protein